MYVSYISAIRHSHVFLHPYNQQPHSYSCRRCNLNYLWLSDFPETRFLNFENRLSGIGLSIKHLQMHILCTALSLCEGLFPFVKGAFIVQGK